jgi:hypothetical protein
MTASDYLPADQPATGSLDDGPTDDSAAWTAERIRALGLVTDLSTAARIFGLSRAAAYDLAKRDRFPVTLLRFGNRYRVPVAAILEALHLPVGVDDPSDPTPAADDLTRRA